MGILAAVSLLNRYFAINPENLFRHRTPLWTQSCAMVLHRAQGPPIGMRKGVAADEVRPGKQTSPII